MDNRSLLGRPPCLSSIINKLTATLRLQYTAIMTSAVICTAKQLPCIRKSAKERILYNNSVVKCGQSLKAQKTGNNVALSKIPLVQKVHQPQVRERKYRPFERQSSLSFVIDYKDKYNR